MYWYQPMVFSMVSLSSILPISTNIILLISHWVLQTLYDVADICQISRLFEPCYKIIRAISCSPDMLLCYWYVLKHIAGCISEKYKFYWKEVVSTTMFPSYSNCNVSTDLRISTQGSEFTERSLNILQRG